VTTSLGDRPPAASLAAEPYTSLAVHYGMLLGVPDFELMMSNPRGKLRVHNAWLHGAGVVWGYPVSVDAPSCELRVGPGLAVDGLGRELPLTMLACLDVGAWFDQLDDADRVALGTSEIDGGLQFHAHLVARAAPCLARPVPAMGSNCEGGASETAYSRVQETVELLLRAGPAPDPPPAAFPSLRRLLAAGDTGVPGDRERIEALATADREREWLDAFHRLAADEVAALLPPGLVEGGAGSSTMFPVDEPGEVLLADLPDLQLVTQADGARTVAAPTIDLSVRSSHVPTLVLADLLAELLTRGGGAADDADAGGPRVASVSRAGITVTVELTADVVDGTLADALSLHSIDPGAATPSWSPETPANVTSQAAQAGQPSSIAFDLPAAPTGQTVYRAVLVGTGPAPLVGLVDGAPVPLAGRVGGPSGSADDGHDVVLTIKEDTP